MTDENFKKQTENIISKLTLEEKLDMLTTRQAAVERLGMKEFSIGCEVARGFVGRTPDKVSTVFPQPVGLASTFDRELMQKLGEIAADESRAYYNAEGGSYLCLWGPTVDLVRDPRWGRTEEAYGEDAFLAGELTAAYTKGMAGFDGKYYKTVPTLKHFCANNNEQDRGSDDSCFTLREKYEYYYAPFMNAISNGGARSVMASYNKVNGVPSVCNPDLNGVLKDKCGAWFVVSDGGGFSQIYCSHHYTDSHSETFAEAIKAGCDIMTDDAALVKNAARRALDEGRITEDDIDKTLFNSLYARVRLGQFDKDCAFNSISSSVIDCPEHKAANKRAALEQVCLLKNDGLLPFKKPPESIAVVGALANENHMDWYTGISSADISVAEGFRQEFPQSRITCDSLWDIVAIKAGNGRYLSAKDNGDIIADAESIGESELFELQKRGENWNSLFSVKYKRYVRADGCLKLHNSVIYDWFTRETLFFFPAVTEHNKILIQELFGSRLCCGSDGKITPSGIKCETNEVMFTAETVSSGSQRAAKIARNNAAVIFCVGNHPLQTAKECFDRKTIALDIQQGIAQILCENNPATVMVLVSSYPYAITEEDKKLSAILYTSHAGAYLGTAVAETVSGKNNPSARLPLTWYAGDNDLHDIKEYDIEKNQATYMYFKGKPLYPFGHGLSYSHYEYSDIAARRLDGYTRVSFKIKNDSCCDGTEIVQIYYGMNNSQFSRPKLKLCGFDRIFVKAGETLSAFVDIPDHALKVYDLRGGRMILESGEYQFFAARSSADIAGECTLYIEGENISARPCEFEAQSFESGENIRICYSKRLHRHYIRSTGWSASCYYGGIDLNGKKRVIISAAASVTPTEFTVDFGGERVSFKAEPSNACDDFSLHAIDIPETVLAKSGRQLVGMTVYMGEAACVEKITIE